MPNQTEPQADSAAAESTGRRDARILRRMLILLAATTGLALVFVPQAVFLSILAVLLAVFLYRCGALLAGRFGGSPKVGVGVVLLLLLAPPFSLLVIWSNTVEQQVDAVRRQAREQAVLAARRLAEAPWGRLLVDRGTLRRVEELLAKSEQKQDAGPIDASSTDAPDSVGWNHWIEPALSYAGASLSMSFSGLMGVGFVSLAAVFLAFSPETYVSGVQAVIPPTYRRRSRELLDHLGDTLWYWLLGRLTCMALTGLGVGLLLWLLNVPLALPIAAATAALSFIPTIGAVMALALAVAAALPQGGATVLLVIAGYAAVQFLESNLLTPLVTQFQVGVPPALLLLSQLVMGALTGFLGVMVAVPMTALIMATVRKLHVERFETEGEASPNELQD